MRPPPERGPGPARHGPARPLDVAGLAERVSAAFARSYGSAAQGVWHAPGRVNLVGEHTDYNEGWVLPFALDRGVVVAAARRDDAVLRITSRQAGGGPVSVRLSGIGPGTVAGWAAYPAGVAWALREAGHPVGGADIAIDSDIPQGAGLSSSAALECAVALALTGLTGLDVPREELAGLARRAENEVVGVPSGIMDQSASLLCREGEAILLDCRSRGYQAVPLAVASAGLGLLVIDTGVRHALSDGRYAQRREDCERAARALGLRSLRDAPDSPPVTRLADPRLRRRVRHVVSENRRVHEAVAALRAGDWARVGSVLRACHASLRDDFEVSWPEAEIAVTAADSAGALGARMMGGGFGGSVLAVVPGAGTSVRRAVTEAFTGHGRAAPRFLAAPPSASARRVR